MGQSLQRYCHLCRGCQSSGADLHSASWQGAVDQFHYLSEPGPAAAGLLFYFHGLDACSTQDVVTVCIVSGFVEQSEEEEEEGQGLTDSLGVLGSELLWVWPHAVEADNLEQV